MYYIFNKTLGMGYACFGLINLVLVYIFKNNSQIKNSFLQILVLVFLVLTVKQHENHHSGTWGYLE